MMTRSEPTGGMLLIHGAWQGSWAWDAWLPEIRQRGWHAHAVDLPGNGVPGSADADARASMESYVALLEKVLSAADGPMVVVAHSGGGLPASQLAERMPERVACLVYVAGMMLPTGMGYGDLVRASIDNVPGATGIAPYLEWSDDASVTVVPPAAALEIFVHDCAPELARKAAMQLRPQQESGRALIPSLSEAHFGRVPRIYVEALQDRSVLLALQRKMQALVPGAIVRSIDCGHVPQLARPAELADLVCDALAELGIHATGKPETAPSGS